MSTDSDTKRKKGASALKSITEGETVTPLSKFPDYPKKGKSLDLGKLPATPEGSVLQRRKKGESVSKQSPQQDDTVVPDPGGGATTEDDYHTLEYNYGDKLPKNRGIPIPMSPDESGADKAKKTTSTDKHSYKVRWS